MFSKVIVGFDGSEQGRDALSLAAALTARDGELTVCCVHRFKMLSARVDPTAPHLDREEAERCIGKASQLLDGPLTVRPLLVCGVGAAMVLQHTAEQQHADLLVLGSHGRGPLGRVVLGSVSDAVVRAAACPVLVVPSAMEAEDVAQPASDTLAGS